MQKIWHDERQIEKIIATANSQLYLVIVEVAKLDICWYLMIKDLWISFIGDLVDKENQLCN